ncbi:hypothetical protein QBD00_001638 [Ochrobactrum sp. AN78]|nr:hypothetical protein [Ochrobactrum sp. AN78]
MKKTFILIAVLLGVSGCQSGGVGMPESPMWFLTATPEQQIAYYSKRCSAYGFKAGTPEMAQCIMTESRSSKDRASNQMAVSRMITANSVPRNVMTTCNSFGNTVTCNSN